MQCTSINAVQLYSCHLVLNGTGLQNKHHQLLLFMRPAPPVHTEVVDGNRKHIFLLCAKVSPGKSVKDSTGFQSSQTPGDLTH